MKLSLIALVLVCILALVYVVVRSSSSSTAASTALKTDSSVAQVPQGAQDTPSSPVLSSITKVSHDTITLTTKSHVPAETLVSPTSAYPKAHELVTPDGYLNTGGAPVTLSQYRGKNVVLLEFWTYSCINCQRTLPYLTSWYGKYKDQGLVIVGVHTPEFSYEHVQANVAKALVEQGITYPVVLDNEYQTWKAYGNQFWPHQYLINKDGNIIHDQIGEGGYDEMEARIQQALAELPDHKGK